MESLKKLTKRINEVKGSGSGIATPEIVVHYWLNDLFKLYDNIKDTSFSKADKEIRISGLVETLLNED